MDTLFGRTAQVAADGLLAAVPIDCALSCRYWTGESGCVAIVVRREDSGSGGIRARYVEVGMETVELEVAIPQTFVRCWGAKAYPT